MVNSVYKSTVRIAGASAAGAGGHGEADTCQQRRQTRRETAVIVPVVSRNW